jgi:hypothetical protein
MSFYLNDFVYGSNEYLMRALGRYVSFEGKVYFFQPFKVVNKVKVNWNVIDLHEVPDFSTMKFFGGLDYGKKDAFVYWIYGINKEDDMYILGEVYQTGLDAREQAKALKAVNDHWGVVPEMIVADNQICNKLAQADALKAHIQSIKDYYIDELGEHYTVWRTEEMDKRDPHIKRDHFDRKLKDGKVKFLRGHTEKSYNEISRLEYSDKVKDKTKGRDDADAVARMVTGANISYENWLSSKDIKSIKAVDKNYQSTRIQKLVY